VSTVARQRESLISGFNKVTIDVPPGIMDSAIVQLPVPGLSAPLDHTGTLRNAPSPFMSLWAGVIPAVDFSPARTGTTYETFFETGLQPYSSEVEGNPRDRVLRPMFGAFGNVPSVGPFINVFQMHTLLPWPPGGLVVRISFRRAQGINQFGATVDVAVAWAVNSLAAYPDLPAIQDLRGL